MLSLLKLKAAIMNVDAEARFDKLYFQIFLARCDSALLIEKARQVRRTSAVLRRHEEPTPEGALRYEVIAATQSRTPFIELLLSSARDGCTATQSPEKSAFLSYLGGKKAIHTNRGSS
jgi:hypothetical protein